MRPCGFRKSYQCVLPTEPCDHLCYPISGLSDPCHIHGYPTHQFRVQRISFLTAGDIISQKKHFVNRKIRKFMNFPSKVNLHWEKAIKGEKRCHQRKNSIFQVNLELFRKGQNKIKRGISIFLLFAAKDRGRKNIFAEFFLAFSEGSVGETAIFGIKWKLKNDSFQLPAKDTPAYKKM